jgi:hypothetical protein
LVNRAKVGRPQCLGEENVAENNYGHVFFEAGFSLRDQQKYTPWLDAILEAENVSAADILAVTKVGFGDLYAVHRQAVVQAVERGVFNKRIEVQQVCPVAPITGFEARMEGFKPSYPVLILQGQNERALATIKWPAGANEREEQASIEECKRFFAVMREVLEQRKSALPPNVAAELGRYGQARWNGEITAFDATPFDELLARMTPDQLRGWVSRLSPVVVPVGGWTVLGAQYLVMPRDEQLKDLPTYWAIMDAALEFQRDSGVWEIQLAPRERAYWQRRHGNEPWLPRREPPSREAAVITPLPAGQERKVTVMTKHADSNEVYVSHPDPDRYVAIVEGGGDRGRVRKEADSAGSLYDLYLKISQAMGLPNHWTDLEFDPFLPFPAPRI